MTDDELSPRSQAAMDLVWEALYCTEELAANPSKRAAGLISVLITELAQIQSDDDRDIAIETVVGDIRRIVPIAAAKLAEANERTIN